MSIAKVREIKTDEEHKIVEKSDPLNFICSDYPILIVFPEIPPNKRKLSFVPY